VTDPLPEAIEQFLGAPRFATISTIDPDGGPRQAVVWYRFEEGAIVVNSAVGRRWPANLLRDARIAIAVTDDHDGYGWIGLNGVASPVRDQAIAQADIAEMARRYHADEPDKAERLIRDQFERQERISFRIRVDSIHDHLD